MVRLPSKSLWASCTTSPLQWQPASQTQYIQNSAYYFPHLLPVFHHDWWHHYHAGTQTRNRTIHLQSTFSVNSHVINHQDSGVTLVLNCWFNLSFPHLVLMCQCTSLVNCCNKTRMNISWEQRWAPRTLWWVRIWTWRQKGGFETWSKCINCGQNASTVHQLWLTFSFLIYKMRIKIPSSLAYSSTAWHHVSVHNIYHTYNDRWGNWNFRIAKRLI